MKKRVLIVAGILVVLIFVAVVIMSGEKKIKITAENGKEYWISYEQKNVWLESYTHNIITLYNEELNLLGEFDIRGEQLQKIEIKYDGTVDNWDYYIMSALTEHELCEWLWKERGDEFSGGMDLSSYIRSISRNRYILEEVFNGMKAYALKKIGEGEYEWLYSYGDALISDGHTELTELIQRILEERKYSPNYITEDEFYSACEEILVKCNEV